MVCSVVQADGSGLMESPKVGIFILGLVAAASLIGGLLGWQIRLHGALPEVVTVSPPGKSGQ